MAFGIDVFVIAALNNSVFAMLSHNKVEAHEVARRIDHCDAFGCPTSDVIAYSLVLVLLSCPDHGDGSSR